MKMALIFCIIYLVLFVVILGGMVALQIFLSKRKSKWPGLVLPISFFASTFLIILLNTVQVDFFTTIMMLFPILLIANIPAIIF